MPSNTFIIPYNEDFIVYRPLLKLAFIANSAMVNLISRLQKQPDAQVAQNERSAVDFLNQVGYFRPDPPTPQSPVIKDSFSPTTAVLFLTDQCNFRCVYCYANGGQARHQRLSVPMGEKAIAIVCQNAIKAGHEHFLLGFHGGGEPVTAWQNFKELVSFARTCELPSKIQLTSNGYWTRKQISWIMEHVDEVSLSFDGVKSIQDAQRPLLNGKGTFDVVMKTIQLLDQEKKSYGIRMTVTQENIHKIEHNMKFMCSQTQCQTFQLEPAFSQGRASRTGTVVKQTERFAQEFMKAWAIAAAEGRHVYYSGARPWLITNRFCQAPDTALIVGPDGFLTSCYEICDRNHKLANRFIFGDLSTEDGLTVNTDIRKSFHQIVSERRQKCRNCYCYWHCAGDCPSKTITAEDGGHLVFGERCELNRRITKELIFQNIAANNGVWQGDGQYMQLMEVC